MSWHKPLRVSRWMTLLSAGDAGGIGGVAGATVYWGHWGIFDPSTSYSLHQITVQRPCMITDVVITVVVTGGGTAGQNGTFSIRKNDTTDTSLGTSDYDASFVITANNVNVALAAGDTFAIKEAFPAVWTAPATGIFHTAEVWFREPV